MKVSDLVQYFTKNIQVVPNYRRIIGMEIETMFVNVWGEPITLNASQYIFLYLRDQGWVVAEEKGRGAQALITKLRSKNGDTLSYELGRHNLELGIHPVIEDPSTSAYDSKLLKTALGALGEVYAAAKHRSRYFLDEDSAQPLFRPTMAWPEDLLVVPDERDATFVTLDGREALNILARTASVQFMFTVSPEEAIIVVNNLNKCLPGFLKEYPQAAWWARYVRIAKAGYRSDRYGGPREFKNIEDYCEKLALHDVITPKGLVPFAEVENVDIPVYLRSIWWHYRLRRFGDNLCVEIRTLPRLTDADFPSQLWKAANAMQGQEVDRLPSRREAFGVYLASTNPHSF